MIELSNLAYYPIPEKEKNPVVGHIYYLLFKGEVVYVGLTTDIQSRILAHKESKNFDEVRIEECPVEDLRKRERQAIRQFKPMLNGEYGNKPDKRYKLLGNHIYAAHEKTSAEIVDGSFSFEECSMGYTDGKKMCCYFWKYNLIIIHYDFETDTYTGIRPLGAYSTKKAGENRDSNRDLVWCEVLLDKESCTMTYNEYVIKSMAQIKLERLQKRYDSAISIESPRLPDAYKFKFGKYKGLLASDVKIKEPAYVLWFEHNVKLSDW